MRKARGHCPLTLPALTAAFLVALSTLGSSGPALGTEDLFAVMGVQRPANPGPAPELALPNLDGKTVRLRDLRGKVVLLGFFTTT